MDASVVRGASPCPEAAPERLAQRATSALGRSIPGQTAQVVGAGFGIRQRITARDSGNGEVSMRSQTSLEHADERDLIETFVERSRWHCRAARETFSTDEFRPVTTVLAGTTLALRHECC